ncbi:MAG: YHYH protein [Verrucomicrobia bacterium]|nr:MAG: YHYH protein [Verrucomicrobiota bacterium]
MLVRLGMFKVMLLVAVILSSLLNAQADAILTSWFTNNSGVLSRVIQSGTLTNPVTTWPSAGVANGNTGGAAQALPAYSDVQRIRYTATDLYINANGLASYTMGPWFTSGGGLFGFWPLARDYQIRITRSPAPAIPTKTKHPGGMIGMMVNGVAIYDLGDAFSFHQTANNPSVTGTDGMGGTGDGYWSRDALAVEVVTFDPGFAHQPGNNGQYHYHAEPKALRYQLGDNMTATYNPMKNTYTYSETDPSGSLTPLHHSPILGWAYDGYPIYGPYGFSSATNPPTVITRMRTGFVLRNGQNGTQDLRVSGRISLPKWAAIAQGFTNANSPNPYPLASNQYGPTTSYQTVGPGGTTTYSLGRYTGDYDYLGDLTNSITGTNFQKGVEFDLDQYNGRNCVTPEFPGGTYAYFIAIDTNGAPAFPYMLGKEYYGVPNAGNATTVPGSAVELFSGGPNIREVMKTPSVNPGNGNVTLTWSSVEGGTYILEASNDTTTNSWSTIATVSAAANATQTTTNETGAVLGNLKRFYRVQRSALAPYDP